MGDPSRVCRYCLGIRENRAIQKLANKLEMSHKQRLTPLTMGGSVSCLAPTVLENQQDSPKTSRHSNLPLRPLLKLPDKRLPLAKQQPELPPDVLSRHQPSWGLRLVLQGKPGLAGSSVSFAVVDLLVGDDEVVPR